MRDEFLWVEKYRPKTIEECILPSNIKKTFQDFLDKGEVPNLLLAGPAGCGKTTVAKALCNQLEVDVYVINGSDEGRFLDTVRNTAKNFASTVSLQATGRHKVIIIDEADNTTNDVQLLLRAFTEEFSGNCRFIFTCNFKNRIIEPIHSRCAVIDYSATDPRQMAGEFLARCNFILKENEIEYEEPVVAELIMKHFPDFRRVLNELQRYSVSGKIDSGILLNISDANMNELAEALKTKNFKGVRSWVVNNLDNDPQKIYRKVYDKLYEKCDPNSIPQIILSIAEYQYKSAFVADQEINLMACLVEIMSNAKFK